MEIVLQSHVKNDVLILHQSIKYVLGENIRTWEIIFEGDNITLDLFGYDILAKTIIINQVNNIIITSSNKIGTLNNTFQMNEPKISTLLHCMRPNSRSLFSLLPRDIVNLLIPLCFHDPLYLIDAQSCIKLTFSNLKFVHDESIFLNAEHCKDVHMLNIS